MNWRHFVIAILLLVFGYIFFAQFIEGKSWRRFYTVKLNQQEYKVVAAITPDQQRQGLSDRQYIGAEGMLFFIDPVRQPTFWMKDMRFPLDFIWIRGDKVVDVHKNVQPPSDEFTMEYVSPNQEVDYVLEVPAGFIEEQDVVIGTPFSRLPIWFLAPW